MRRKSLGIGSLLVVLAAIVAYRFLPLAPEGYDGPDYSQFIDGETELATDEEMALIAPVVLPEDAEVVDGSLIRVIDGDTIALGQERIRIANIDAPESGGRAECEHERFKAELATTMAEVYLADAGEVAIWRDGQDRYRRTLAIVYVDRVNLGNLLVHYRAAVPWAGRQHDWCADEQAALLSE